MIPEIYDDEKRALNRSLKSDITRGLLFYYVFAIGATMAAPSWGFAFWVLFLLPLVGVLFYYIGARSYYEPLERFVPGPTMRRNVRRFEMSKTPLQHKTDEIGRQIARNKHEGRRQSPGEMRSMRELLRPTD